jgi:hypothetical protein
MGASILTTFAEMNRQQRETRLDDHRLLLGPQENLDEDGLWKRASANDDIAS